MPQLEIGLIVIGRSSADHVSIHLTDRSTDWIDGTLEISVGPWSGTCRCSFYRGELSQLAVGIEKLYKDLVGVAQLIPIEPHLELKFTGDGKGHILVEGRAQHRLSAGTSLEFTLELDQTELLAIANGLLAADPPV
jgi:hypothetical protein